MKLKKFLMPFLLFSILTFINIPKTYAFEINGATFENVRVYNSNGTLIHSVTDNVNNYITTPSNQNISYYFSIGASDNVSISTGQMLIYTNICTNFRRLQIFDRIENEEGTITKLELIANNTRDHGSCTLLNGEPGSLVQNVYSFAYSLQRNPDNGYSFLDSKIYWKNSSTIGYLSWTQFINVYLAEYDETVIQNLKQQQISEETNTYLQEQIEQQQQTNEKLDNIYDTMTDTSLDTGTLENSAGWLPAGPVDSILNLPLSLYQNLLRNLQTSERACPSLNINLPYLDDVLVIPCLTDIFNRIDGLNVFWSWVGTIGGAFILFNYFINLYKWVDATLTMRENNHFGGY